MSKRFLAILAACFVIFAGLLIINKKDNPTETSTEATVTNHTFGEGNTGVTLIEYGDFQCPACFSYFPLVTQLREEYKDRVTFQFRHFPLVQSHQNAMAAHRAAEAAGLQGKFWEMHDLLFQNQKAWEASNNAAQFFEDYATQLELDIEKFKSDVASSGVNASVQADFKSGQDLGVSSTPSFILDGKLIENPTSIEAFKKVIDDAIAGKQQ